MRLMWRAHVQLACALVCAAPVYLFLPLPGPPPRFLRGALRRSRIKAPAADQLEAIRSGRVAVEGGRSLGGDAAGRLQSLFDVRNDASGRVWIDERKQVISDHPITASASSFHINNHNEERNYQIYSVHFNVHTGDSFICV